MLQVKTELYHDNFQNEIWKDIRGYKGLYQISSSGKIRSVDREITQEKDGTVFTRKMKGRELKTGILNSGYQVVWLSKNGIVKALTIHRLVAKAFIPNPQNKKDINHIDGNKTNNKASNLEWTTRSENVKHSHEFLERKSNGRKIKCVETGEKFNSIKEASIKMNINRHSINHVLRGRNKKAGGYTWMYLK